MTDQRLSRQFDPSNYLTKVGSADYLEVKWRLAWLRAEHPDAIIETEQVKVIPPGYDPEGTRVGWALFKARVTIPGGGSSTGWGSEDIHGFGEFIEKAETKALGRALAALGFGTQFSGRDWEHGGIVDSPVKNDPPPPARSPQETAATTPQGQQPPQPPRQQGSQQGSSAPNLSNPDRSASPRQRQFVLDLIKGQGENPKEFEEVVATFTAGKASEWIGKLQAGELPWLNGPKV